MEKTRIIIVDDHKILRVGLKAMLNGIDVLEVVHEAPGIRELFAVLDETIGLILMDVDLADGSGIDATRQVKERLPRVKVLAISMHEEPEIIGEMIKAGADGYIMKDAGDEELTRAVLAVLNNERYLSNQVSRVLMDAMMSPPKKQRKDESEVLSLREIEVLKLICQEMSNAEIAEKLFISVRTVDTHRRNLLDKLMVKNTAGLVKYAVQKGYL